MARRKDESSESLSCAVIYLEDVEEIVSTIKKVCDKVVFVTDKTEFDSLEEIREHVGNKLRDLEIAGSNTSSYKTLSVNFSSYSVYMYRSASDAEGKAAWYYLRDLIKKRRRLFNYILNEEFWISVIFILFALLLVFANLHIRVPMWLWGISGLVFVVVLIGLWGPSSGSVIYLTRKHQTSNFWARNKDELVKLFIAALLGAAITLLVQFLTKIKP